MSYNENSVAVIFHPHADDEWNLALHTPFEGSPLVGNEKGYIIANTPLKAGLFDDFQLLKDRFLSLGSIINEIDFIQKTASQSSRENTSNGIGGLAKLKDVTIKLVNKGDLREDKLYDRKIEIRLYESSTLTNASGITHFYGSIFGVEYQKMNTIILRIRGIISSNNPRINGEPFINSQGKMITSFIVIGQQKSNLVRLEKTKGAYGVQLHIDESKYEVKDLYIKENNTDDMFPVTSKWKVIDDKIFFDGNYGLKLVEPIGLNDSNIYIQDGVYMEIFFYNLPTDDPSHDIFQYFIFKWKQIGGNSSRSNQPGLIKIPIVNYRVEIIDSRARYIFTVLAPYHILNEDNRGRLDEILNFPNEASGMGVYHAATATLWYYDDSTSKFDTYYYEPKDISYIRVIQDEIIKTTRFQLGRSWHTISDYFPPEIIKYDLNTTFFEADYDNDFRKTTWWNVANRSFVSPYDKIQKIIQVEDEKMLIFSQKFIEPSLNRIKPQKQLSVIRGYEDTEIVSHSINSEVIFLTSEQNQKPKIKVSLRCKDIIFTDSVKTSDFLKSYKDFHNGGTLKWPLYFSSHESYYHMGLYFGIPDITGEIDGLIYIDSEIDIDYMQEMLVGSIVDPDDQSRMGGLTLSISPTDKHIDEGKADGRNFFGINPKYYNDDELNGIKYFKYSLIKSLIYNDFFLSMLKSSFYTWKTNGALNNIGWESDNKARLILHSQGILTRYKTEYIKDFTKNWFGVRTHEDLKNINIVLKAYKLNPYYQLGIVYNIKKLKLKYNLVCPIKDNDWYAKVKYKGIDIQEGIPVSTFYIGENATIAQIKYKDKYYIVAESDLYHLKTFLLDLATGVLIEFDVFNSSDPDMSTGWLAEFIDPNEGVIGKVSQATQGYAYIRLKDDNEPTIVKEAILITTNPTEKKIGSVEIDIEDYRIIVHNNYIKVFHVGEILNYAPIPVLKFLLTEFCNYELTDLYMDSFDIAHDRTKNYKASVIIEKEINANVQIDELCKNFGFILYENNKGLLAVTYIYPPSGENNDPEVKILNLEEECLFKNKLPEISYTRIDLKYLITDLIIRYEQFGDVYKEEILSKDMKKFDSNIYFLMMKAREFTNNKTEVALGLRCVQDKLTAKRCAYLKMLFHAQPTRIITLKVKPEWIQEDLGSWFSIPENDFLKNTQTEEENDKLYLLLAIKAYEPIGLSKTYTEITLFEFDPSLLGIQEVYLNSRNKNYDELFNSDEDIQEVI
ncbi:MAG: hypothetical protein ACTSXT_13755 [Candidatus Helarchaeota archaeon]